MLTEDKFEATYQVTYLSHFLLVSHLLPIMEKSGDECRIVFISSQTHQQANFDADYASGSPMKKYDGFKCFAASNLFQVDRFVSVVSNFFFHFCLKVFLFFHAFDFNCALECSHIGHSRKNETCRVLTVTLLFFDKSYV